MMLCEFPVTPLANGMWRWGGLPIMENSALAAHGDAKCRIDERSHATSMRNVEPATAGFAAVDLPDAAVSTLRRAKKDVAAPYRSVDPRTGRVWGAPSAFGRGQCIDCPNKAMMTSNRCEACLKCLSEAVHEPMRPENLSEMRCSFDAALAKQFGNKRRDCAERLQQLYDLLDAGKISVPIQSKLIEVARGIAVGNYAASSKEVSALSAQHWEEHKEWLMGMKRLLSV